MGWLFSAMRASAALPAGREDQHLAARQAHGRVEIDGLRKVGEIAVVLRDLYDPVERAPGDADPAPRLARDLAQRLKPRDIAGEGGDDDTLARMARDLLHQRAVHRALAARGVGVEDVGGIAHQREHALVADGAQFLLGGRLADDRLLVELPVAGVEDAPARRVDQQCVTFRDGVRERQIGHGERPQFDLPVILGDDVELDLAEQPRLLELPRHEVCGEGRGIERHAKIAREIGNRADMVLVRVGEHDADEVLHPFLDELEIGEDEVDPRILAPREGHAEIDHQPLALAAVEIDVHADLARAAQRQEQQFVFGGEVFFQDVSNCSASALRPPPAAPEWRGRRE